MCLPTSSRIDSRSRGDTMVEVLIAIAVVAMVMGGAYVTTNRSLMATRAAEERSIALKLAESQVERLKGLMASDSQAVLGVAAPFCISGVTGQPISASDAQCSVGSSGLPSAVEPVYRLSIAKPSTNDFVLTVQWYNVRGQGQDSLQLRYRAYD